MDYEKLYGDTTLVIPAYNEADSIVKTIEQIPAEFREYGEVLVVDDGSVDNTYKLAKGTGVRVLKHEENKGKCTALETGISAAKGDIIVTIDADCTYPAHDIERLIRKLKAGNDLVVGSRFAGKIEGMRLLNRLGNMLLSQLASIVAHKKLTDAQSGFRAFHKDLFFRLKLRARSLEMETEMTTKAARFGFKVVEVPIHYKERVGKSKLHPLKDGARMFKAILHILFFERHL